MRVLVTRPRSAARRTAARLAALGHEPVLMPLTAPVLYPDTVAGALQQPFSAIALTSATVTPMLAGAMAQLHINPHSPVFAVGQATAATLRDIGYDNIAVSGGTAGDLAAMVAGRWPDRLSDRAPDTKAPVLYLTGKPRTGTFEAALAEHQIPCRIAECYEMLPVIREPDGEAAILATRPDAVLFYSREAARIFFGLETVRKTGNLRSDIRLVCLGPAIGSAIPETYSKNIVIADSVDEDGLLAALQG